MKIFALNLCLEFEVKDLKRNYDFEAIGFEDLMGYLFKGTDFDQQKFYVDADDSEDFRQHIFELQANDVWREMELTICFKFKHQHQYERFCESFMDMFRQIDAAGGLVGNEKGEYLGIFNRSRWSLPKGGVEWREPIPDAAVREVKEETGLDELELMEKIGETYHTFRRGKKWVLKTTHWFKMSASSKADITPQLEERIEAVAWKTRQDWINLQTENTYPLIRHIFEQAVVRSLIA